MKDFQDKLKGKKLESVGDGYTFDGNDEFWLELLKFTDEVRIIEPGYAYTMDFQPNRVNIYIDEDNLVYKIDLG